jgi:hypothetical protein
MSFDPPGLYEKPDEASLIGFRSLMPPPEKKPSKVAKMVKAPVKLVALPFKAIRAVATLPAKLFGGSNTPD